MQSRFAVIALLGFVLIAVAACTGGGSEDQLRMERDAALEAQKEAEEKAAKEEADRKKAEAEAAEAERKRKAAEQEAEQAKEDEAEAERLRQEEEEKRTAAEAERQRLADEAEKARQEASAAKARIALDGFAATQLSATVVPSYRTKASVTAVGLTPTSTSTSSSGRWFITRLSDSDDDLVVYSDVGAPKRVKMFGQTKYAAAFNDDGTLSESGITPGATFSHTSSRFKTNETVTFPVRDHDNDANTDPTTGKISGTLDGAGGYFECTGTATCTVSNTGGASFTFGGTWSFHPSSKDATVSVNDDSYMYFGAWVREAATGDSPFTYSVFSGGEFTATDVTAASGTATYSGPAIGQYAVHQPATLGGSASGEHGSFTARASLTANFDGTPMLGGTITNFSNAPNWRLVLENTAVAAGAVEDGTLEWSIGGTVGTAGDNDEWNARFYRDNSAGTAQPEGVAGWFQASYGSNAELRGAFGAHRQ